MRGGKPAVIRPTSLHISLPEDIRSRLDLHLWSDAEQRVPKGAYRELIVRLLREYLTKEQPC